LSASWNRGLASLAAAALALAAAGCGLGPGRSPRGARLTVTDDYGRRPVVSTTVPKIRGADTVMRLLQRNARVGSRYGGGFVQSIDGLAGGHRVGRPIDWFYYVNGVEATKGAAATEVHSGDRVWWDRHDWGTVMDVHDVVGSFPEPFLHGLGGRRLPVRVECSDPTAAACSTVAKRLVALGVPAARGGLETARTSETLRVLVGPWTALRNDLAVAQLAQRPTVSEVFARVLRGGRALAVLDPRGRITRTLGARTGLVAALRYQEGRPVWVVTGTDAAGVEDAARALDEATLADRFALATSNDVGIPLPDEAP
jgi:hypothetical protein